MSLSMLDTHRAVKRLMEAGFSSDQAETVTDMLRETRVSDLSDVATKADLQALEAALKGDIQALRADMLELRADFRMSEATLKADIRTVQADLRTVEGKLTASIADSGRTTLQWAVGLFVAQTAIIVGLIKLIH